MDYLLFLKNFIYGCFFITNKRKSDLNKAKYIASLDNLENNLKKEEKLGYQRHFIKIGNRIRRVTKNNV